jgi:hypothetical protein
LGVFDEYSFRHGFVFFSPLILSFPSFYLLSLTSLLCYFSLFHSLLTLWVCPPRTILCSNSFLYIIAFNKHVTPIPTSQKQRQSQQEGWYIYPYKAKSQRKQWEPRRISLWVWFHRAKFPSPQKKQCINAPLSKEISNSINGYPCVSIRSQLQWLKCTCLP